MSLPCSELDKEFPSHTNLFSIPTLRSLGISDDDTHCTYMCGNSLGLMPKAVREALNRELDAWKMRGVESHFNHPFKAEGATDWVDIDLPLLPILAPVVGAKQNEVAVMGSLTTNLNSLLVSFYKPQNSRTKILFEKHAFPSDYYAFLNIVKLHGFDESHLIQLSVKPGETYLQTQDILDAVTEHELELALVCFSGVQYYTGQLFDIAQITSHAQKVSSGKITVGWDLAHAVGNVPLSLHDWGVDFATWCSYKYLNSGPGAVSAIFVHEKYTKDLSPENFSPRLAGWWGNNSETRFQMLERFDPIQLALSYRQLNPSVLDVVLLKESLMLIERAGGMSELRQKSVQLTQFLQDLLQKSRFYVSTPGPRPLFQILTPLDPSARGCQLSLLFHPHHDNAAENVMELVHAYLHLKGVICDERRPDVIRIAPTPLYNTFQDVAVTVGHLNDALEEVTKAYEVK